MQSALRLGLAATALWVATVKASPRQPRPALSARAHPTIDGYEFAGCYTEATGARALTGRSFFDDAMTIQKCMAVCTDFIYFGVEYGRECYCGDDLGAGSVATDLSECSFTCPGDPDSNCGAGNRLSLYIADLCPDEEEPPTPQDPTSIVYRGCYAEPEGGRALGGRALGAPDMTITKCAEFCKSNGYPLFGLEYYSECYCGFGLGPGTQSAPESECSFPCAGDNTQTCGGDWRLNVYGFGTPSSGPADPSLTSSTSSASTPVATGAAGYSQVGCYTEATGVRALSSVAFYDDAMTAAKCGTACQHYDYFGLEYGRECYCSNSLNEGSEPTASTECSFPCPGQPLEFCGAGNRLNLYRKSTLTSSFSTPVSTTTTPSSTPASSPVSSPVSSSSTPASSPVSSPVSSSTPITTSSVPSSSTTSTTSTSSTTSTTSTTSTVAAGPTSIIRNGGFEEGAAHWATTYTPPSNYANVVSINFGDTTDPLNGTRSASITMDIVNAQLAPWFGQDIVLTPNKSYRLHGYFKGRTGCSSLTFGVRRLDTNVIATLLSFSASAFNNQWKEAGPITFSTSNNVPANWRLEIAISGCTSLPNSRVWYFDDLSLVQL